LGIISYNANVLSVGSQLFNNKILCVVGVLVFIITLATSAIVGAIEGDAPKTKSARPSTKKTKTSLAKWLDEDNK
jgi:hypothetical protein